MTGLRFRGEEIRRFILENVEKHNNINKITATKFKITRQAVNKHLQRLVEENVLSVVGKTRNLTYKLASLVEWQRTYEIKPGIEEATT